jgi:hypothetical protein
MLEVPQYYGDSFLEEKPEKIRPNFVRKRGEGVLSQCSRRAYLTRYWTMK